MDIFGHLRTSSDICIHNNKKVLYYLSVDNLEKLKINLKKQKQNIENLEEKIKQHSIKINELTNDKKLLGQRYNTVNLKLLSSILDLLNIDLFVSKDMYLYIIGFIYAVNTKVLNDEQLRFFKLLAEKYLEKAGEKTD